MSLKIRALLFLSAGLFALSASTQPAGGLPTSVPGQVIVGFYPGTPGAAIADAHRQAGGVPVQSAAAQTLSTINASLVRIASGNVPAAIAAYERNPNVRYAEPNYLRPLLLPDEGQDPKPPFGLGIDYFAEQYGLNNTGQSFYYDPYTGAPGAVAGAPDADIDAPEAWNLNTGSPSVVVAVLDSGVDCVHPDLAGKCVEETNFGPSSTLDDVIGHGTHVAGIIGATGNNGSGVAGVGWYTSIAAIKVCYEYYDIFYGYVGLCDSAAAASGMIHAADQGYQVINMSFAGPDGSQTEASAANYAWSNGTVLVAAAANSYEMTPMYPAAFPEVIAVAATDWFDNLAGFSNFGNSWVSLAAPGYYVFNTLPNAACGLPDGGPEGCYGWLSGTSMASPTVAGAAAVVWAQLAGGGTNQDVRNALELNADQTGALGQDMLAWTQYGRLNLYSAVANAVAGPPPPSPGPGVHVGDLDASAANAGSSWLAQVTVTVHDETETPASNIVVQGSWSNGASGVASCTTSGSGQCTITSGPIAKKVASATFTISGLSGGYSYQETANHDPDGDSNGRSITVIK